MLRGGGRARYSRDEPGLAVLYAPLEPVPQLLVLGAGLDAIPLVGMAADLGWRVTVVDHRPAYLQRGGLEQAERALLVQPDALSDYLALDDFAAVIVMSHHLATDRKYLRQLASARAAYLGILGPAARRERLLAELAESGLALHARLRGPVGLDIGADSPESIALSILAEMQATFAGIAANTIRTS
jgi:xanthine/CO dehydrogenase XdhC/CoxF family maturation factor